MKCDTDMTKQRPICASTENRTYLGHPFNSDGHPLSCFHVLTMKLQSHELQTQPTERNEEERSINYQEHVGLSHEAFNYQ